MSIEQSTNVQQLNELANHYPNTEVPVSEFLLFNQFNLARSESIISFKGKWIYIYWSPFLCCLLIFPFSRSSSSPFFPLFLSYSNCLFCRIFSLYISLPPLSLSRSLFHNSSISFYLCYCFCQSVSIFLFSLKKNLIVLVFVFLLPFSFPSLSCPGHQYTAVVKQSLIPFQS